MLEWEIHIDLITQTQYTSSAIKKASLLALYCLIAVLCYCSKANTCDIMLMAVYLYLKRYLTRHWISIRGLCLLNEVEHQ